MHRYFGMRLFTVFCLFAMAGIGASAVAESADFDFSNSLVPLKEIVSGGVDKDGIPSILYPEFLTVAEAKGFLTDDDRVLALAVDGAAKAYPIKIMNWHEVVNDSFNKRRVFITYCPLCGSGIAFDAEINGKHLVFGVSGLLYNSDLLFYDYGTESLWSQIEMKAITGRMSGTKLKPIPLLLTTWGKWKKQHPETLSLAPGIGMSGNYKYNPYGKYQKDAGLIFPVSKKDDRYHPKSWVIGIKAGGVAKAYPFSELKKSPETFTDRIGGTEVTVHFDKKSSTASITDSNGRPLPAPALFWFAWYAFNPDTLVYTAK